MKNPMNAENKKTKIRIVSGTDRPGSNALKVSEYLKKRYEEQTETDADTGIIDLQDFPTAEVEGGKYGLKTPASVKSFYQPLLESDGLIMVCPEYNGGYPGILKLFIDYLPFPESLNKKPICFVGEANGAFGALRAVEQLQQVVGYRNAHVFPERVFISRVNKNFDEKEGIREPIQQKLLDSQIKNFIHFVKNLNKQEG